MRDKEVKPGEQPGNQETQADQEAIVDKEAQALEAAKLAENLSKAFNTKSDDIESLKSDREVLADKQRVVLTAIAYKKSQLDNSGKVQDDGTVVKLLSVERAMLNNEILNLEKAEKVLKKSIAQIDKKLKELFRKNKKRMKRSDARERAGKQTYHKRSGDAIKGGIDKVIGSFSTDEKSKLKAAVEKTDITASNKMLLRALKDAPRNLLTRVVANPEARKDYLQHFRSRLNEKPKRSGSK